VYRLGACVQVNRSSRAPLALRLWCPSLCQRRFGFDPRYRVSSTPAATLSPWPPAMITADTSVKRLLTAPATDAHPEKHPKPIKVESENSVSGNPGAVQPARE
jgi:hypothetical protein